MDREQARFILRSYRPGGADRSDADFAEALRFAKEDEELGRWLAEARAFDGEFAAAFNRLTLPATLRESILSSLQPERNDLPALEHPLDGTLAAALAAIQPPANLRVEILTVMERSVCRQRRAVWWWRALIPAAAAAGVVLAFTVRKPSFSPPVAIVSKLPVEVVQTEFIRAFESPQFTLDEKRDDQRQLLAHLKERRLPCPGCLPRGLCHLKSIGCRELVIDGRVGSIICFAEQQNGVVHLVVFRRQDVAAVLPDASAPELFRSGKWAVARWADAERVFVLIGDQTEPENLARLF